MTVLGRVASAASTSSEQSLKQRTSSLAAALCIGFLCGWVRLETVAGSSSAGPWAWSGPRGFLCFSCRWCRGWLGEERSKSLSFEILPS
jgi:hypothetical protein